MKVILIQDVKGQGKKGQVVNVSDGYAKNFLLPRNLAIEANASNMNVLNTKNKAKEYHNEVEREKAQEIAKELLKKTVIIKAKAGSEGRLFGSVTAKEIGDCVNEQLGFEIDKRKIVLDSPIKSFGEYELEVKLYQGVTGKVKILVKSIED